MFDVKGERVVLVTDSACDLSDAQLAAWDIRLVPLRVSTTHGEFRDRLEIDPEKLYTLMETELPKTSLPLPGDVADLYRSLLAEGADHILHLTISSGLSGTFNMVSMVASEFPDAKIDVVDTLTLSAGEGLLVLTAAKALAEGSSVPEAIALVREKRKNQLGTFVIKTLEFLRKGGRIGLVEGVVGSLLQIKPVIFVDDQGVYETLTKARGFSRAVNAMEEQFAKRYERRPVNLAIVHGGAPEEAAELEARFCRTLNVVDSFISPVSPALAIHTGRGLQGAICQLADV